MLKNKDNLFVLLGPTAVGKTSLSIDLAKKLNGEIISADSMQIYKYMNIGTAKITPEEMDNIPHHLVDFLFPDEDFTVSNYKKLAEKYIKEISNRNCLPMLVGGTGLFINSLVYKLNFTQVPPDESIRLKYENMGEELGDQYLHNLLSKIDKASSDRISIKDRRRIIRALEIYEVTGKPMSQHNMNFRKPTEKYNLAMVGLTMDRKTLYERINQRVEIMIEEGLVNEVESILSLGYDKSLVSMQGIGYKEIIMYLEEEISLSEAIGLIQQKSRNYAKRQLTWFRRDQRIKWVEVDKYNDLGELSDYIREYVLGKINLKI